MSGVYTDNPPSGALFPPGSAPLESRSGFFTVVFFADSEVYLGDGVSARFSSAPGGASQRPQLPASTGAAFAGGATREVQALSAADIQAAFTDPSVATVVLAANIDLAAAPQMTIPPNRAITIRSSATACASSARPQQNSIGAAPRGLCALDARPRPSGAAGLFAVRGAGASLALEAVAVLGASAHMGAVASASDGAAVSARGCHFANCSAVGDGGVVFATGVGTTVSVANCASAPLPPQASVSALRVSPVFHQPSPAPLPPACFCRHVRSCDLGLGSGRGSRRRLRRLLGNPRLFVHWLLSHVWCELFYLLSQARHRTDVRPWEPPDDSDAHLSPRHAAGAAGAEFGSAVSVHGSSFTGCSTAGYGGSVAATWDSKMTVQESVCSSCSAGMVAGCIYPLYSEANVTDVTVSNGTAGIAGGALWGASLPFSLPASSRNSITHPALLAHAWHS